MTSNPFYIWKVLIKISKRLCKYANAEQNQTLIPHTPSSLLKQKHNQAYVLAFYYIPFHVFTQLHCCLLTFILIHVYLMY